MAKILYRNSTYKSGNQIKNEIDYLYYSLHKNDNSDNYYKLQNAALIKLYTKVFNEELTPAQARIVQLVKVENLKVKEAANILGVNPSTVSRGLKAAQKKFDLAFSYYNLIKHIFINDI